MKICTLDPQAIHLLKDLKDYHLIHRYEFPAATKKRKNRMFLQLRFINKGMEFINLERILNEKDTKSLFPENVDNPILTYKYNMPIRNTIFNYKKTIKVIDNEQVTCPCSGYPQFCDQKSGHVVTGNLDFIRNEKLRELLSFGPSYRPPTPIDWTSVKNAIRSKIQGFAIELCRRKKWAENKLNAWVGHVNERVHSKIEKLRRRNTPEHKMTNVLQDPAVKKDLNNVHDLFVLVPADKASNNVIIVCKRFYLQLMREELGLNDNNSNSPYTKSDKKINEIVNSHVTWLEERKIPSGKPDLPYFYGTPKMHKKTFKLRYIAASHKCTTSNLATILTKALKLCLIRHRFLLSMTRRIKKARECMSPRQRLPGESLRINAQ
jgi:hypothetical protein